MQFSGFSLTLFAIYLSFSVWAQQFIQGQPCLNPVTNQPVYPGQPGYPFYGGGAGSNPFMGNTGAGFCSNGEMCRCAAGTLFGTCSNGQQCTCQNNQFQGGSSTTSSFCPSGQMCTCSPGQMFGSCPGSGQQCTCQNNQFGTGGVGMGGMPYCPRSDAVPKCSSVLSVVAPAAMALLF